MDESATPIIALLSEKKEGASMPSYSDALADELLRQGAQCMVIGDWDMLADAGSRFAFDSAILEPIRSDDPRFAEKTAWLRAMNAKGLRFAALAFGNSHGLRGVGEWAVQGFCEATDLFSLQYSAGLLIDRAREGFAHRCSALLAIELEREVAHPKEAQSGKGSL